MSNVIIRNAIEEDCDQLLALVKELAIFEKAPNEVTITKTEFIKNGFRNNPIWWAKVAEITENSELTIVGFALYYKRFSTWKGVRMYLEDIIVTEKWRRNGIGKLLFDALIVEAREKNFKAIVWQVLAWNELAINFYKKYNVNFEDEWINARLDL